MLHSELLYPHNNSMRLTIEEMSLSGKTGLKYSLFLYNKSAEKWQKRKQSKTGKYLILFQSNLQQFIFYYLEHLYVNKNFYLKMSSTS